MKESNFPLRMNRQEKILLKKIAKDNLMSINDYIKYRLFHNNWDINDEEIIFEAPPKNKHAYLTVRMLQDIYLLLLHSISEHKTTEEAVAVKDLCRSRAETNIAKLGYLKLDPAVNNSKTEEQDE